MYLLQSGVTVTADVNDLPFSTIAFLVGAAFLGLFILLFFAAKHLSKAGPFEFRKNQIMQAAMDNLANELFDVEKHFRDKVRIITKDRSIKLENIFIAHKLCAGVLIGVEGSVPWPLFESAIDNHFTTELLPENIETYINRLVEAIGAQYVHVVHRVFVTRCMMQDTMITWDEIKPEVIEFAWDWVTMVKAEVIRYCKRSKETCLKYEEQFNDDSVRGKKVLAKMADYDKSIAELERSGRRNSK
jgi:hypothetical protein